MSFLDDVASFGKTALAWLGSDGIGPALAKTAITGYALNKITSSINKQNATSPGQQQIATKIQVNPDTEARIPVVYGQASQPGIITDVALSSDNKTLFLVIAISEKTGNVNLGAGAASAFSFESVYFNDEEITFESNGITAKSVSDREGNINANVAGLIKVYCYNNGSENPVVPSGYSNSSLSSAYSIMPDWTANHTMDQLVFAIVSVTYDKEKSITSIPTMTFEIKNTMNQPGDCMYDYMTNTRYGASIADEEIYVS